MSKIHKNTFSYLLCKSYINWTFKKYYNEVIIVGEENIPNNEAVIYAPNHTNALMDALAILSLPPLKLPKVFIARADIFNLHKLIVKFIRWTKIIPAYRIRDGYDNLAKNQSSFDTADEVLLNKAAMCLMPEGSQETEHRIRPLVKGIFRIAFSTQQKMSVDKSVYILPIGLNYGDIIKHGKHLIINIGKPIPVIEYIDEYTKNPAKAINNIRAKLKGDLEKLSLHIASEEYYETIETAIQISHKEILSSIGLDDNTYNLFTVKQRIAEVLDITQTTKTEDIKTLAILSKKYKKTMQKINLPFATLEQALPSFWKNSSNLLKIVFISLIALPGVLLHIIPYILVSKIPRLMRIKYEGFFSSIYYVGGIILFPLFYLLQSVILSFAFKLPIIFIPIFFIIHYFVGKATVRLHQISQDLYNQIRYYNIFKNKKNELSDLQSLRVNILQLVKYMFS